MTPYCSLRTALLATITAGLGPVTQVLAIRAPRGSSKPPGSPLSARSPGSTISAASPAPSKLAQTLHLLVPAATGVLSKSP